MKFFALLISFFILLCSFSIQMIETTNGSKISEEDIDRIEKLLSYLVLDEGFAYSLFGSKPMSTIGHDKNTPAAYQELYQHPMFELESWWETWEKYSYLFPIKDFFLFAQNSDDWFEVFLINKSNALSIIKQNLSLFRDKLGESITPKTILENIVASRSVFVDGLNKSQALFGLLLGYGKENAIGFEKCFSTNRKSLFMFHKNSAEIVPIQMDKPIVPCFSSFSDKETYVLLKQYNKEKDKILQIYSTGSFLETTLNRLVSYQE